MASLWRNVGMCYSTNCSWVAKHKGRAGSTLCLPSCLTFSSTLFPPLSLFGFVREMRIYRAMILAMRVRDDIHTQRYTQALCVLSGIISSVSTKLCLSHKIWSLNHPIQYISLSPFLSLSHYSQTSLYPNIGIFLPMTAPCRAGNSVKVYICSRLHINWLITLIGPPPPGFQGCENERNDIHNVRVLRQKLKVLVKLKKIQRVYEYSLMQQ